MDIVHKCPGVESLIESIKRGEDPEPGFQQLCDRYYRPLAQFFVHRGLSHEASKDLAQETFLHVYLGLKNFRGDSSFETWLFHVATNVWRNALRSEATAKRRMAQTHPEGVFSRRTITDQHCQAPLSPEEQFLEAEQLQLIRRAVADLPPRMRSCLLLRLEHELKYEEISIALSISIDTVKSQLQKAKRRLRAHFTNFLAAVSAGRRVSS